MANVVGAHGNRRYREQQSALPPCLSQLHGTCSDGGAVCLAFKLPLAWCYLGLPHFAYSRCEQIPVCPVDFGVVRLEKM